MPNFCHASVTFFTMWKLINLLQGHKYYLSASVEFKPSEFDRGNTSFTVSSDIFKALRAIMFNESHKSTYKWLFLFYVQLGTCYEAGVFLGTYDQLDSL